MPFNFSADKPPVGRRSVVSRVPMPPPSRTRAETSSYDTGDWRKKESYTPASSVSEMALGASAGSLVSPSIEEQICKVLKNNIAQQVGKWARPEKNVPDNTIKEGDDTV